MILRSVLVLGVLVASQTAYSQCAPGIPSAGNPGCIPPNQSNSPYYQQSSEQQPPQPEAVWEDRWGAIAIDSSASAAGAMTGLHSKRDAIKSALDMCESKGGTKCEVVLSFHNQCAAMAQRLQGGVVGSFSAATKERAEGLAIKDCGNAVECKIIYSDCSYSERVR